MAKDTDFEHLVFRHDQAESSAAGPLFETFADRAIAQVRESIERLSGYDYRNVAVRGLCRQRDLLRLLLSHVGRNKAVPLSQLTHLLNVSEREVKGIVQDLRRDGMQIGASRESSGGGYYIITDEEESRETAQQLVHQAVSMLKTARALRGRQTVNELLGQVRLELEADRG